MNNNLKRMLPKLLLFLVVSVALIIVITSLNDMSQIGNVLGNVSWGWLAAGFGMLIIYMFANPFSLFILGRSKETKVSYANSMMIGTMEYFFNGITPFSSGGQPFQVYAYNKIGVKPHRSSGILLINFVVTQTTIVFLCLMSLIFYQELTKNTTHLEVMIIIGLTMNFLILGLFTSLGLSKTVRKIMVKLVTKLLSLKIFKGKLEKYICSFENYCNEAQATFKSLLKQKLKFACCLITKLIGLLAFYSIPFFILRSLHIEIGVDKLALITAMTTFAVAMTCFIPTPGSAGGIEFAFQSLFMTIIPTADSSIAVSGMLLWRLLTYYFLMVVSFIVYLIFERIAKMPPEELEEESDEIMGEETQIID